MPIFDVTVSAATAQVYRIEAEDENEAADTYPRGQVVASEATSPTVDHITLVGPSL